MLKKVVLFICSFLFSLSLFGLLVTLSFRLLVTPANTKKWVEKSHAYQTLPDALRSQASIANQAQQDYNSELVAQAARTALTSGALERLLPSPLDRAADPHRLAIFGDGAAGDVEALFLEQVDQRVV
mgnify:CR=1 FL=1